MKCLDRLRDVADARQQRDLFTGQPFGVSATAPVLVERTNGRRRCFGKPQPTRNAGAALAADRDQLIRELVGARSGVLDR
jgi:hypothetical protein